MTIKMTSIYNGKHFLVTLALLTILTEAFVGMTLNAAIMPDDYEPDNGFEQAEVIVLNYHTSQKHTFHETDDEDWVQFYALEGEMYRVKVSRPQVLICDPVIELFDLDGSTRLEIKNDNGTGEEEYLLWTCPVEGIYFVRLTNGVDFWGSNVWYELSVDIPGAFSLPGYVSGTVSSGGQGLSGAALQAGTGSGLSQSNGSYILSLESGTHNVFVSKNGYLSTSFSISVPPGGSVAKNVELIRANNSPPTISGITDTTVMVGNSFLLVPIASDPDGDSITFTATGTTDWMNFNTMTGSLSGTPDEEHLGMHGPITITVRDYYGASTTLDPFMIRVISKAELENYGFLPAIFKVLFR